jgi:methylthioribose-1-phosphate isomerase
MNAVNPFRISEQHGFKIEVLDQRILPHRQNWIKLESPEDYIYAIRDMVVRGAPLIGFTAIFGCANWFSTRKKVTQDEFLKFANNMKSARPTAINLAYEVDRIWDKIQSVGDEGHQLAKHCWQHALDEIFKLNTKNRSMAKYIFDDLSLRYPGKKLNIVTICNTGRLACGTIGTALGAIEYLQEKNMLSHVYACETRPYLQGSRLTAFELKSMEIDFSLIVEGAMRQLFKTREIHAVFAGADRIALNGDTANKVGTATLAEIANVFKIPFYIVAPLSSFDIKTKTGDQIPIEFRSDNEITELFSVKIAPNECKTFNPSFDVTPAHLITGGIACENGLLKENFEKSIMKCF